MEIPGLGVKSELPLPAYTTATATPDLSHIWDLHSSLWQLQILNPLSEVRDRTRILMGTSQILNLQSYDRNTTFRFSFFFFLSFLPFLGPLPGHVEVPRLGV